MAKRPKKQPQGEDFAELSARYAQIVGDQATNLDSEEAAFRKWENEFRWLRKSVAKVKYWLSKHGRQLWFGLFSAMTLLVFWFLGVVVMPRSITYQFATSKTCITSFAAFPQLTHSSDDSTFLVSRPTALSFGRVGIFATELCVSPKHGPAAKTTYKEQLTWELGPVRVPKHVYVKTASYASIAPAKATISSMNALPLLQPMEFKLNTNDATFEYFLSANGKQSLCKNQGMLMECDLQPLGLSYGAKYNVALEREFAGKHISTVMTSAVTTITATAITNSSIAQSATVYDVPQTITLTTSKKLTMAQGISLTYQTNGKPVQVPVTSSINGSTITVAYKTVLPRQTTFTLHVASVTATDNSQLAAPYDLAFTTSGGPKVTGVSIGSYGVSSGTPITISFDQPLLGSQSPAALVSLTVNGSPQAATYAIRGNTLTIAPTASYPVCARLAVTVTDAVQSQYGIKGNSAWSYSSRSICYTTFSIGTSRQGRPITAYQFGSGATMVLYIGAMHGNEQNSMRILQKWITALDAGADKIPSNRTIVVIPAINPDGVANNQRVNAASIDLNRNFPTNDWQTQVTEPDSNGKLTNDGGPSPLSEPESQALAAYVQSKRPRLVLTYHSHAGVVEANDAADSDTLGRTYAASAGYRAIPTFAIGNTFDYSTTGAFEDWANQKLGIPALVIELTSGTNDEFSQNQAAMWTMAKS